MQTIEEIVSSMISSEENVLKSIFIARKSRYKNNQIADLIMEESGYED